MPRLDGPGPLVQFSLQTKIKPLTVADTRVPAASQIAVPVNAPEHRQTPAPPSPASPPEPARLAPGFPTAPSPPHCDDTGKYELQTNPSPSSACRHIVPPTTASHCDPRLVVSFVVLPGSPTICCLNPNVSLACAHARGRAPPGERALALGGSGGVTFATNLRKCFQCFTTDCLATFAQPSHQRFQ